MDILNLIHCYHEEIKLLIEVATLIIAFYGLNNWRLQLQGTNRIKLSKNLLSQVYLVRDLINDARIKVFFSYENPVNKNLSSEEKLKLQFENRIQPIKEALVKLEKDYYDAYVEWGLDSSKYLNELKSLYFELIQSINLYLEYYDTNGQEKADAIKIVFENSVNDNFKNKLDSCVKNFDNWLRPKFQCWIRRRIKKKSPFKV
jgi:hypothetical protein